MARTKKPETEASRQVEKFKEAVRQLQTDKSEAAFDNIVKRIAEAKHAPYDEMVIRPDN